MIIRQETTKDYDEIYSVVKSAFESAEHADGSIQLVLVPLSVLPEYQRQGVGASLIELPFDVPRENRVLRSSALGRWALFN